MFPAISLHNNPWIASFQLLFWLLFQPSAWCHYVTQIDSKLEPDFALGKISRQCQHHENIKQLRKIAFKVTPILVGLLTTLLLSMIHIISLFNGQSFEYIDIVFGVTCGMLLFFIGNRVGSFAISLPFGLIAGVFGGILIGVLLGLPESAWHWFGIKERHDDWSIILGIFALSIAGNVIASLPHKENHQRTWGWKIGSFVIGIIAGIFALFIVLGLGISIGIAISFVAQPLLGISKDLSAYAHIIGMAFSVGFFLCWFLKGRHCGFIPGLIWGLIFGSVMTLLIFITSSILPDLESDTLAKRLFSGPTIGTIYGLWFTAMFALSYLIARHISNVWAGVVAGILGIITIFFGIMLITEFSTDLFLCSLISLGLGLTLKWWLPILMYPIESAISILLYREQQKHPERTGDLLRWHPAFWDEHQHFPLWGLEKLIVAVYKYNHEMGETAKLKLSQTSQSWAIQAVQIEANTQHLENCRTVQNIAKVHEKLVINNELESDMGHWLHNFFTVSQSVTKAMKQNTYQQLATLEVVINPLQRLITVNEKSFTEDIRRIKSIAINWQRLVEQHINQLQEVQEIPNPYIFGPPLEEGQEVFVPRPNVDSRIKSLLNDRSSPPLLLYGQRRTGKTSLLKNLVSRLPDNFIMLFVDCQGTLSGAQNQISFFYNLGRAMIRAAKKSYPDLTLPPLTEETVRTDPVTRFDEWLDDIEDVIGNKTILLALDEFITLDNAFNDGRLPLSTILGLFRNLIQNRRQFRLLFSGTHTFEELQHWANYLINVQAVHLNYLLEEEARLLIEHPVKNFPLHYAQNATQRVMQITHNQPALVQLLCGEIVQMKEGQTVDKRLHVQIEDVESAIPIALQSGSFFFADIEQNQIDDNGRLLLHLIASKGEGTFVSQEFLLTQLPTTNLAKTLNHLLQRELIEENENKKSYRFQIELVRRWFFANQEN
jgi:hypothetical protein